VQIRFEVLAAGKRPSNVPPDTAGVPYELRVKGILRYPAVGGERATIVTPAGRVLQGVLEVIEPADMQSLGRPPQALIEAQENIRKLLQKGPTSS
jgi:hypothetical protein